MGSPVRTCIGCRRRAPQDELVRIVRRGDGTIGLDHPGRSPGRGAYVCNVGCFQQAVRRRRLGGALRTTVDAAQIERLTEEFTAWPK